MKKSNKIFGLLACLCMVIMLVPAAVFAAEDTFTVIYMTNAGVKMGTVEYTVGNSDNAFPASGFGTLFPEFVAKGRFVSV